MTTKKIAVLGAGPMGLAAAYQLVQDGFKPVIYEASDRIGGMATSFDFSGLSIERYYHFHCLSDAGLMKILKELNLGDKMHWTQTRMGHYCNGQIYPWGTPADLLAFPHLSLLSKLRYGLHAYSAARRKNWAALDKIEAVGWIKKWMGDRAYETLWQNLFAYKFYHYADNVSAAWIWSRINRIGRSRTNLFTEKLGYIDGGSETLLQAMKTHILRGGGELRLNCPVDKVGIQDNRVTGLYNGEEFTPYDTIISTIPLPFLPAIMPDLPKDIIRQYQSVINIAVICVIVRLKKSVSPHFWLNINDPDMDIPGLVEYTNLRPLNDHIVYIPFYMPADMPQYKDPDEAFINKVKHCLKTINPAITDDDVIDITANRYRYAQPVCPPGFLQQIPPFNLPVTGLFAADTSYYYPHDRGLSESVDYGRMMAQEAVKSKNPA